jgi:hypothetical protein
VIDTVALLDRSVCEKIRGQEDFLEGNKGDITDLISVMSPCSLPNGPTAKSFWEIEGLPKLID